MNLIKWILSFSLIFGIVSVSSAEQIKNETPGYNTADPNVTPVADLVPSETAARGSLYEHPDKTTSEGGCAQCNANKWAGSINAKSAPGDGAGAAGHTGDDPGTRH